MEQQKIVVWGAADIRKFITPKDSTGGGFPRALSYALPMTPAIMAGIQHGPNRAYADEYTRVNDLINEIADRLAAEIRRKGFQAQALAASERSDPVNIKGDFPQKTAATRAGLGWIGRHCQLITRKFGSWEIRFLGSSGNRIYRHGTSQRITGGAWLLRHLHALCRGLPGRGTERQGLGCRNAASRNPGCCGL
jgi:hypothetical protein